MRAMLRSRLLIVTVALAVAFAAASIGRRALRAQAAPLQVASTLPAWLAPGGRLVVRGTAAPGETVALFAESRKLAQATSAATGAFVLRARAPHRGSYVLTLRGTGDPLSLGKLLVRPLRLFAVGDVNLGDRPAAAMAAAGVRYPWLSVAPVLRRADIAVANLECAVSTRGSPSPGKEFTFRGSPTALRAAARFAGIDVVSLANNHSLDYGRLAFADTFRYARKYGLATTGGGRDLAAARRPATFRIGGLRVALLAYSDVRPPGFDAGFGLSGAAPAFPSLVAADVRAARRRSDVVVVYFHWGQERTSSPNARQRSLADLSFQAGAEIVLGAHPHVLQPIERRGRRRLVAWSLGNFVFGANSLGTERTGVLRLGLGAGGVLERSFRRARIAGAFGVQPRLVG